MTGAGADRDEAADCDGGTCRGRHLPRAAPVEGGTCRGRHLPVAPGSGHQVVGATRIPTPGPADGYLW